ncbi:MAG: hypothetical protein QM571_03665 [Micrococcaceae bacterium]
MFGINGTEFMILIFIAIFIVGPDRMPKYAKDLARYIRKIREMSESAKSQIKDEMGEDSISMADIKKFDPRQYDPRKIIKEALSDDVTDTLDDVKTTVTDFSSSVDSDVLTPTKNLVTAATSGVRGIKEGKSISAVSSAVAGISEAASGFTKNEENTSEAFDSNNNSDSESTVEAAKRTPEENVKLAREAAKKSTVAVDSLPTGEAAPFDPEAT